MLTTQNPVDLDYKALSNAGTWFVGKLQTEQDKARLLDGLEGAAVGEGGFNRTQVDKLISTLGKRIFLLHNVHEKAPQVFRTRWAMAYLRGPITRAKLQELNALVGAVAPARRAEGEADAVPDMVDTAATPSQLDMKGTSTTRPSIPERVEEVFLPNNLTVAQALKAYGREAPEAKVVGLVYKPALLAQVVVRYLDRKIALDHEETVTALTMDLSQRGVVRWEEVLTAYVTQESLDRVPAPEARFTDLEAPLKDAKMLKNLEMDFIDYIYHGAGLRLPSNPALKLVAEPGTTKAEFRAQCAEAAREGREADTDKLKDKYEAKIKKITAKLVREERELAEDQAELSARKMEEMATHAENVLGLFSGSRSRRRVSSSLTKRRMTAKAKADVEESLEEIEAFKQELVDLEEELAEELEEINERWAEAATDIEDTVITPYKKNIHLELFGVAWFPHWRLQEGDEIIEAPEYGA